MGEFKAFDGGEPFVQPDQPFLLIYETRGENLNIVWFETEEDLMECADGVKRSGCQIVDAIEIGFAEKLILKMRRNKNENYLYTYAIPGRGIKNYTK